MFPLIWLSIYILLSWNVTVCDSVESFELFMLISVTSLIVLGGLTGILYCFISSLLIWMSRFDNSSWASSLKICLSLSLSILLKLEMWLELMAGGISFAKLELTLDSSDILSRAFVFLERWCFSLLEYTCMKNVNRLPYPFWLVTVMSPLSSRQIYLQMDRPTPLLETVWSVFTWLNGVKICLHCCSVIPTPASCTST